jgi:hypothetical protein
VWLAVGSIDATAAYFPVQTKFAKGFAAAVCWHGHCCPLAVNQNLLCQKVDERLTEAALEAIADERLGDHAAIALIQTFEWERRNHHYVICATNRPTLA